MCKDMVKSYRTLQGVVKKRLMIFGLRMSSTGLIPQKLHSRKPDVNIVEIKEEYDRKKRAL
jgi:hypothetical protein